MPIDQTDTPAAQPVDRGSERKAEDSQKDLSRSVWEDLKGVVNQGAQSEGKGLAPGRNTLEFGFDKLYGSVHDAIKNAGTFDATPTGLIDVDPRNAVAGAFRSAAAESSVAKPGEAPTSKPADAPSIKLGDTTAPAADAGTGRAGTPVDSTHDKTADKSPNTHELHEKNTLGASANKINRDIEPAEHVVKPGDNLTKIAKEQLGPDATPAEIHQYVKEIAKENHLRDPNIIIDGHKLMLPGHTSDGGYSKLDADGNKLTEWPDRRQRIDNKDGTGLEWKPDGAGGYTERHWGPSFNDKYDVVSKADGTIEKTDAHGTKHTIYPDNNEKFENKDGTGYTRNLGADGKYSEHHWGPHDEDNYDLKQRPDGSYQGKDKAGNTHTKWDDGKERVDYPDGRGYTRTPDGNGGYSEHHWGKRPEDNFDNKVNADGKVEVQEKPTDKPHEQMDGEKVKGERDKLNDLAEKKIHDPQELAKFQADMARMEERMKGMEETYKKEGLSPDEAHKKAQEQVEKTYANISRLLEAKDNPATGIDEAKRTVLAEQIMSQAANPTSIDQGMHPTCNVTTVESRTYTRNPADASQMVVDVATTGQYTTKDGHVITVDKGSLEPQSEWTKDDGAKKNPPNDGQRSYARQIFQVTAVNVHYQRDGDGHIHYEQHKPDPTATPPDNGERLMDYSKTPPEEIKASGWDKLWGNAKDSDYHAPGLSDEEIVDIGRQITGDKPDWYVRYGDNGNDGTVKEVKSEEELNKQLADAKEHGKLPMVVKVHSGNEPLWSDSGNGAAGGSGGWHVVTMRDYEPGPPAKVKVDNQ